MKVSANTDRLWQNDTGGVYGLENIVKVTPPCDFLDENWGQSLGPKLLVDAKEIYFYAFDVLGPHAELDWYA